MLMHEKKRLRALKKGCKRQANYRQRQRGKMLDPLQLRITRKAHKKALELKKITGWQMSQIYAKAIEDARLDKLPLMHEPATSEDELGIRSICPWVSPAITTKFEQLTHRYRSTLNAMSAILFDYCSRELNE